MPDAPVAPAPEEQESGPTTMPPIPAGGFDTFKSAARHLRRPFAANALKFKVQSQWPKGKTPTGGLVVAYIDARLVTERLNAVIPHLWSARYKPYGDRIDTNAMICQLTVGENIERSDVGIGQGQTAEIKIKAAYSDALKRAAVHLGVGVSLYALPQWRLNAAKKRSGDKPHVEKIGDVERPLLLVNHRDKIEMTPRVDKWLRAQYEDWLEETGRERFGDPLDHGDVADSVGDLLDGGEAPVDEDEVESDADLALAGKRMAIEEAYAALAPSQRKSLPPGRFRAHLEGADTAEELEALAEKVAGFADKDVPPEEQLPIGEDA